MLVFHYWSLQRLPALPRVRACACLLDMILVSGLSGLRTRSGMRAECSLLVGHACLALLSFASRSLRATAARRTPHRLGPVVNLLSSMYQLYIHNHRYSTPPTDKKHSISELLSQSPRLLGA